MPVILKAQGVRKMAGRARVVSVIILMVMLALMISMTRLLRLMLSGSNVSRSLLSISIQDIDPTTSTTSNQ